MTVTYHTPDAAARAAIHDLAIAVTNLKPGLFNGRFQDVCESIQGQPDSPGKTFLLSLAAKLHGEGNDELFVQTVMCLKEGSMLDIGIPGTGITVSHHTVEQAVADQRREGLETYFDPGKKPPVEQERTLSPLKHTLAVGLMATGGFVGGVNALFPEMHDSSIKHVGKVGAGGLLFTAGMMLMKKDQRDQLASDVIDRINPLLENNSRLRDNIAMLQAEIRQVAAEKKKGFGR